MVKLKNIVCSIALIFFIALSSCSKLTVGGVKKVDFVTKKQLLENVSQRKDFKTLNYKKVSILVENPESGIKFNASIKIKKDSIIQISLKPGFGIEAIRIGLTKDSVLIINRINKTVTKNNYEFLKRKYLLDINYNSIQSMLIGDFFTLDCEISDKSNIDVQRNENYVVEHYCIENKIFETNTFNESFRFIGKHAFSKLINSEIEFSYDEFFSADLINLPKQAKLRVRQKVFNTNIMIEVRDVVLNEDINFNMSYSSKYSYLNIN